MNKTYLTAIATALLMAPIALAHDPPGTPKNYCEPAGEWNTHDYGPPASGVLLHGWVDGKPTCNGGPLCTHIDPFDPLSSELSFCPEGDGHHEFAFGGAWLLVTSGDGQPDPFNGAGTKYCFGEEAHHPMFGPFSVSDLVLGAGATFTVASDSIALAGDLLGLPPYPPSADCGDYLADHYTDCLGTCSVVFGPGLDGAYHVFVQGTQGHVIG
jgi:hypothetical protein